MATTLYHYLVTMAAAMVAALPCAAQIVTTSPTPLQEESENVVLTYHADSPLGNNGLKDLDASVDVYAHIGAITNKSASTSDWKYAPKWGDNSDKYKLEYVSANTYDLEIGDIRTYFGITDDNERVEKIALVFRTGDCKKEGKTASGGDIFVDVAQAGFQISLSSDAPNTVLSGETTVTFTLSATMKADLSISANGVSIASASGQTELTAKYDIKEYGSYVIDGIGEANGEKASSQIVLAYPHPSTQVDYPGGVPTMGTVNNADGSVTFCIAAPQKSNAILVPSWDGYNVLSENVMNYQDCADCRYFWITVDNLPKDEYLPYYFLIDGQKVGDPCAELVLDCYNDKWLDTSIWPEMPAYPYDIFNDVMLAVYCGNKHDFKFSDFEIPSHDNLIIYEMLFRDFTGTEGQSKGNGTVKDALDKLPYIKSLGVNAVELMPIMEFNGNNSWGYNTNFYMAPDKAYGSPLDYKEFIEECHKNGIAVILDIVFNQSDGLHPWYQLYPIASNPFYNKKAPHDYSVLNDWNQDNEVLQQYWAEVLKYWLTEYNVDGFRFDLVKGLGSNDSYSSGTDAYNKSRVDNMKRLHAACLEVKPNAIHINENLAQAKEENEMGEDGQLNWSNVNYASCQYAMGWADGAADLKGFYAPNWSRTWGTTVAYAESHDEERMGYKQNQWAASEVKNDLAAKMNRLGTVAVHMLLAPGSKMIWQFGELGANQTTKSSDGSNDTSPKKVIWSYADVDERAALLDTYAALCNARINHPELFAQDATYSVSNISTLNARTIRVTDGTNEIVAFVNGKVSGSAERVSISGTKLSAEDSQLLTAGYGCDAQLAFNGDEAYIMLEPSQYAVYVTKSITSEGSIGIDAPSQAKAYGGKGEIIIVGSYVEVGVHGIDGRSYGRSLQVPAGLYIVNIDGMASKVLVK